MDRIRIIPTAEQHAEGFNAVVDIVARERRYIDFVDFPGMESTRAFLRRILSGAGVQTLAVTSTDQVVVWCDIIHNPIEGFWHVGWLGMEVFASNERAVALYENWVLLPRASRNVREKLDGRYDGNVFMALFVDVGAQGAV